MLVTTREKISLQKFLKVSLLATSGDAWDQFSLGICHLNN